MHKKRNTYRWELGQCHATQKYASAYISSEKCCISNGDYLLSCTSSKDSSWDNSFVTIKDHKFCDDMIGHNKFIVMNMPGT